MSSDSSQPSSTVIYRAKRVITMNPSNPSAEAVAVRDGRILGVGTVEELQEWGSAPGEVTVDDRFADKVLTPGFVEAHVHLMAGSKWASPYVGFFDRSGPDGQFWPGCRSVEEVLDRLREADAAMDDPDEMLTAWGLDPIYLDESVKAVDLDRVSTTRPIFVHHASAHLATVNTILMEQSGITADTPTPGVVKGPDGKPDGELQEPPAMALAGNALARMFGAGALTETVLNFGAEARNAGLTFVTDLATGGLNDAEETEALRKIITAPDFPARVMLVGTNAFGPPVAASDVAKRVTELKATVDPDGKLHFGVVKIVLDGSIQGFTARISWPHYFKAPEGHPGNGLWLVPPEQMAELVTEYHKAGMIIHTHCNGDQASQVFIDAVQAALDAYPRADHRHTATHCQLTTKAQYKRMAALGMCANIFSNHIFYWGDQHRDITVGPERARAMDACATAEREGVPFTLHCDAPITPMGPLHVAWCAVNRLTATGQVLGPEECISVESALHAVTLGAAYQIGVDHLVGSIECGKMADFAVLDDDPFEVDPVELKDIGVWGTVLGGVPQPAPRPSS